jgi:hypothetical protein
LLVSEREDLFERARNSSKPSTTSTPSAYHDFQSGPAAILDGRHGDHTNPVGLPVEIYNPAFATFLGTYNNPAEPVSAEILSDVSAFINHLAPVCTNELGRHGDTCARLEKLVGISFH